MGECILSLAPSIQTQSSSLRLDKDMRAPPPPPPSPHSMALPCFLGGLFLPEKTFVENNNKRKKSYQPSFIVEASGMGTHGIKETVNTHSGHTPPAENSHKRTVILVKKKGAIFLRVIL